MSIDAIRYHSEQSDGDRPTIVLIHGLFLNYESWQPWIDRYTARGCNVLAPGWPGMHRTVEELRADPSPMKGLSMQTVADFYETFVRELDEPPIVIGHSFGGFFAQLLAYRGACDVAVGLDPTAPAGLYRLPRSSFRSALPVLGNPLGVNDATVLTPEQFHYGFTNTENEATSRELYDRWAIPCVNRVFFEGTVENFVPNSPGQIDVKAPRRPVLLIAGGEDHIVTPGYTRSHFELIADSPSVTGFREFPGRPHFINGVSGWEDVADYALDWALDPVQTQVIPAP